MQKPNPALQPCPALFDVTTVARAPVDGQIQRIELDALELAPNARREISREGIERLAGMLMRTGQLVPCIGHRPDLSQPGTVIYDGQRRLLAAQASAELAGADGYEGLAPVQSLIVLLLDHEPGADEIRRIQAQAYQRENLSLVDQQGSCATAGTPAPADPNPTGSPPSAPTSASRPSAPTTSADSSRCRTRSAPASPSAPPASRSQ